MHRNAAEVRKSLLSLEEVTKRRAMCRKLLALILSDLSRGAMEC